MRKETRARIQESFCKDGMRCKCEGSQGRKCSAAGDSHEKGDECYKIEAEERVLDDLMIPFSLPLPQME